MNKKIILSILSLALISCQSPVIETSNQIVKASSIQTFKVSENKGATLSAKIYLSNSPLTPLKRGTEKIDTVSDRDISSTPSFLKERGQGGEFSSKANTNGVPIKRVSDIKSLKVYLLKTSNPTISLGSDPLNAANIVYQTNVDVSPTNELTVTFNNVASSTATFGIGSYYHIAVRAFDATGATGNEIILANNGTGTPWINTTAATPKTAVTTTGLQVRDDLVVSQTNNLEIILNLQGQLPTNDAFIQITDGNPRRVKSYSVNFCTDPTRPDATKVLTKPLIINTDSTMLVRDNFHRFELSALTNPGTYYLTLQAYDQEFNNGNSFVKSNNGSATAYTAPDANKPIAVSSNTLTLDANLNYTFSSLTYFDVKANLSYIINTIASIPLNPRGIVVSPQNNDIYVCQRNGEKVLKIDGITNAVTTIAGTDTNGFSGDNGQATAAELTAPRGLALDSSNNLYIADGNNYRIRKVNLSTGIIITIAGNGTPGYVGDNIQATATQINLPFGVSVDSSGNVYIADSSNHRIRKVTASTGIITTIAGTGAAGYNGDNIQATSAQLNNPKSVTVDSFDDIYISDTNNDRVRKVTASTGIITTIAGTGTAGYNGDNIQATSAQLNRPVGQYVDKLGSVYIADGLNNRIRKITASTGIITTIAGTGTAGFSGDGGVATNGSINIQQGPFPEGGIAGDNLGNIYIADYLNDRIRKLE